MPKDKPSKPPPAPGTMGDYLGLEIVDGRDFLGRGASETDFMGRALIDIGAEPSA